MATGTKTAEKPKAETKAEEKTEHRQVTIFRKLDEAEAEFRSALPAAIPTEKFIRTVKTVMTVNPKVVDCTLASIMASCLRAAADGLVLDGREAALIPRKNKTKNKDGKEVWVLEATYQPMIAGIHKKARNSGEIGTLAAYIVRNGDEFILEYGADPKCIHKPKLDGELGAKIGVYSVCRYKDGMVDVEYMTAAQVAAVKNRANSKGGAVWDTDADEMWRKTVTKRHAKRLPLSPEASKVLDRINDLYDLDDTPEAPQRQTAAERLQAEVDRAKREEAKTEPKPKATAKPKNDEPPIIDNETGEIIESTHLGPVDDTDDNGPTEDEEPPVTEDVI